MKIPIKPLCEEKRVREDGTSLIYFQWFHDGEHRVFLNTQLAIPPKYWNKRKECVIDSLPPEYGVAATLNEEIDRQLDLAKALIKLAKDQHVNKLGPYVKRNYQPGLDLL